MWNMIDSLPPVDRLQNHSSKYVPSGWITIRVFVSSTFDDFHSEREILVKQVCMFNSIDLRIVHISI